MKILDKSSLDGIIFENEEELKEEIISLLNRYRLNAFGSYEEAVASLEECGFEYDDIRSGEKQHLTIVHPELYKGDEWDVRYYLTITEVFAGDSGDDDYVYVVEVEKEDIYFTY